VIDFAAAQQGNLRRSRGLVVGLGLVAATLGLTVDLASGTWSPPDGFPLATTGAVAFTFAATAFSIRQGDRLVLASLGARPADFSDPEEKQLGNLVHEMAIASGLPMPRVYVIPDPAPNALATGRDPAHATVAVTSGLLAKLNRAQTQGVIAHEMGHVRTRDTRLAVMIAVLLGSIALLADAAWRMRRLSSPGRSERGRDGVPQMALVLVLLFVAALAPLASRLIAFAISRQREYLADATAVELTRNPLALAGALEVIGGETVASSRAHGGTAHLFFVTPRVSWANDREGRLADLWATHPPIAERIARLKAMAAAYPDANVQA